MQYTAPHYYRKFQCIGGDCPDTCCAGWQIQIDPASLRKYRKMKGPLGNRLKNEIVWKEGCFRRYDGRCAFLNENNLCDLYLEGGGEKAFCRTCRTYPRHIEEFEGLREISLSLSCPVAASLILSCQEKVRFLHGENPDRDETYEDFDFLLFTKLMDTRSLILHIIQDRSHPIGLRAAVALALAHDLQERIDRNALFDADSLLDQYSSDSKWPWFEKRLKKLENSPAEKGAVRDHLFDIMEHLEALRDSWKPYLREARNILKRADGKRTDEVFYEKNTALSSVEEKTDGNDAVPFSELFTDVIAEQLLVYFIFTYFCGAVYNENAYGKMKFSLAGMLLIRELVRARWIQDPSAVSTDTVIDAAVRYSREVEHSDENKIMMEQFLDNEDVFGLEDLFLLLL